MLGKSSAFYKPLLRWRIGLILGFAALFIFSIVRTNLISRAIEFDVVAAHRLESSYRAQLELDGLFSTVKEAETGQKGFLLTTDPSYLDSYENLRDRHDLILDEILSRFAELQIISNNLPLLHELIHEKFAEMDRTISLVRNGQVDLAMLGEANGSGRMIMDRIRKVSDGLIEQLKLQRQSLAQQSAAASESTQTINSVSGLITLPLIFLLFVLSWTSVHAFFRNKEYKSEAQVELEKAVQMRTRELKTAKDELEAFSYSVSHDLRGPLRAVISYASMLEEDYADKIGEEGQEFLERIKASGRRMSELIDTLLALSRLSRAEISIETIDASAMAEEILGDLAKNEPDATTTYSVEPNIQVKADRKMLMTLLENLLRNAWKFSARSEDPHIEVSYSSEKHAMVVRDNGVGFNEEYASKLFQPFQRLHSEREFEGLGIGLAIVDRIVSRHGGRIWAESKEGEGATFFVDMEPSGRSTRSSESAPSVR